MIHRLVVTATALLLLVSYHAFAVELTGATQDDPACADSVAPIPSEWWSWSQEEFDHHLNCDAIIKAGRPLPNDETWVILRKTYRQIVGDDSTISRRDDVDGFDVGVPIHAGISPGKGRGLFATQDIPQGTRVWTSRRQCACFYEGDSFRKFLASLPTSLACDVLMWAYVEDFGYDEGELLCCDLDKASLMNTKEKGEDANVGCVREVASKYKGGCADNIFALRTIRAGEEILCDYDDFDVPDGWTRFGL